MKLKFISTRLGNKFFFISTLTCWHFSCRNGFTREWLRQAGPLSASEKKALRDLTTILKKYRFGNPEKHWKYLGEYFMALPEDRVWKDVCQQITSKEFLSLVTIFDIFEPRFAKIWKKEEARIAEAIKTLQKVISGKKYRRLIQDLEILFQKSLLDQQLTVLLCMRPSRLPWYMGGGSAIFGKNRFSLEAGDVTAKKPIRLRKVLPLFFHEATHAALAKPIFERKIGHFLRTTKHDALKKNIFTKQEHSEFSILNEGIVSSLFPDGYLDEKYFHANLDTSYKHIFFKGKVKENRVRFGSWRIYAAYHLRPFLVDYLAQKRPLDMAYIKRVHELFLKFLEAVK